MAIDKGLSFRVEATPHEGIGSKGLSVKVKVRKKQDAGTQYDTILKIKKVGSHDKTIHLVQSEATMTYFDMIVEKQKKSVKKKRSMFRNFKPGGCLDPPFDEDRHKYTPTSTAKSSSSLDCKNPGKYKNHESPCVAITKEEKEHPIEKSSSASVLSLFRDLPACSLNAPSSNTIITYPTHAKRSKVSTTSSKKSIDENRKKSFSQTTELYFKPKSDDTGAKSPSKVSKKNISREGHRSVDSDTLLLPYIQEVAKAQMQFIQEDPIFDKTINKPEESQSVPVSDDKNLDNAIIADYNNNKRNEFLTGRSTTLSDAILKTSRDSKITSESANNNTNHIPIASTAGLMVAGLTAAGLTAAAYKQPQDNKTLHETVITDGNSKKEDQYSVGLDDKLKIKTETPQDTKDRIDSVSIQTEIVKDVEKPTSLSKQSLNKDINSASVLSKNDAITTVTSQEPGCNSLSGANLNEVSEQTPVDDIKSKPELKSIEKTSFTSTQTDTFIVNKNIAPSLEERTKQPLSIGASIKDIKSELTTPETKHSKSSDDQSGLESKREDKGVIKTDNTELRAGAEEVSLDTKNKEFIQEESIEKIPTQAESHRQEHDSVTPVFDLSQSKNVSVISLAQIIAEHSTAEADSRISRQSQIRIVHSSDIKVATKDSKVTSSPRGSTKSLKLIEETKANVFPLHKATSSHSTDHGDFVTTTPPIKSSLTDPEKRTKSQYETALATDEEYNVTSDIKTSVISIAKNVDMEAQLDFEPQTDLPVSMTSSLALHNATENAKSSPSSTTANKALSTLVPERALSGDESTKIAMRGSLAGSQTSKGMNLEAESTKIAMQESLMGSQTSKGINLEAESTKIATEGSLAGSQTSKGINLEAESTKIATGGFLAGSQTSKGINLEAESTKIATGGSLAGSQTSKGINLEAESTKMATGGSLAGSQTLKGIHLEAESTKIATRGSLAGSQTSESINLEAKSTKIATGGSLAGSQTSKGINLEAESTKIATRGSLAGSQTSKGIHLEAESTKIATGGSLAGTQTSKGINPKAESTKIATGGFLAGSQTSEGINLEAESTKIAMFGFLAGSQTSKGVNLEAEPQVDFSDNNTLSRKKNSDISARDSKQSVNQKLGSTLLQKPITNEVGTTETPIHEPAHSEDLNSVTVVRSVTSIKDFPVTSADGSRASIDKTAQTEKLILKDFKTAVESAKDFLRTGERSPCGSITSSVAPSIDIDQTDQFLVDIAFNFSRNGAAKQTILKSVDAESASNQLSGLNNIISHKSTTSNPFEHPIEIPISPKYNISLKLNQKHKSPKEKRKIDKKYSKINFDISNKAQKHGSVESNLRRKGLDINIVLETIYKEQLQPLERNIKKLQAEILLLTKEQAYIQRTIYNLTEKRSSIRTNRVKRSVSCLCKRNI